MFPGLNDKLVLVLLVEVVWLELPFVVVVFVAPDEAVLDLLVGDAEVPVPIVFEDVPLVSVLADVV